MNSVLALTPDFSNIHVNIVFLAVPGTPQLHKQTNKQHEIERGGPNSSYTLALSNKSLKNSIDFLTYVYRRDLFIEPMN
jgi:hypothetical protein